MILHILYSMTTTTQVSFIVDEQLKRRFDFWLLKNNTTKTAFFVEIMKQKVDGDDATDSS